MATTPFAYSFVSCAVIEGAVEFEGLRGIKVTPKLEGGKPVMTNKRKARSHTVGQVSFDGSLKLLLKEALNYLGTNTDFFRRLHTFTVSVVEGANKHKITVVDLRFTEFPVELEGNEEVECELAYTCLDFQVNGVSIAPEVGEAGSAA